MARVFVGCCTQRRRRQLQLLQRVESTTMAPSGSGDGSEVEDGGFPDELSMLRAEVQSLKRQNKRYAWNLRWMAAKMAVSSASKNDPDGIERATKAGRNVVTVSLWPNIKIQPMGWDVYDEREKKLSGAIMKRIKGHIPDQFEMEVFWYAVEVPDLRQHWINLRGNSVSEMKRTFYSKSFKCWTCLFFLSLMCVHRLKSQTVPKN